MMIEPCRVSVTGKSGSHKAVMMKSRHLLYDAFVLHARPFRNSSQIVDLFTAEQGKIGVVARGVTRGKSPQTALLQPFRPIQVAWSGRGELHTLNAVEPAGASFSLSGRRMFCGLYANELMVRLLHRGDPHPEIFTSYHQLIERLSLGGDEGRLLRHFEITLLQAVGFGFDLHRDSSGLPIEPQQRYRYHPEEGMVPAASEQSQQTTVFGETLQWLRETEATAGQGILREARQLLRSAIDYHIPGELQSRKLIAQYSTLN